MEWAELLASIPRDANGRIKPIVPSGPPDPRSKLPLGKIAAHNHAPAQRALRSKQQLDEDLQERGRATRADLKALFAELLARLTGRAGEPPPPPDPPPFRPAAGMRLPPPPAEPLDVREKARAA